MGAVQHGLAGDRALCAARSPAEPGPRLEERGVQVGHDYLVSSDVDTGPQA